MKKLIFSVLVFFAFAWAAFAASLMTPTYYSQSLDGTTLIIKVACTAHTDGTFTDTQITGAHLGSTYDAQGVFDKNTNGMRAEYWQIGYYLDEVWAVNPASGYPTLAATVSLKDALGLTIMPAANLSLSTASNGIAEAALTKNRAVSEKLTLAIGDTGTVANTVTIYIKLRKIKGIIP